MITRVQFGIRRWLSLYGLKRLCCRWVGWKVMRLSGSGAGFWFSFWLLGLKDRFLIDNLYQRKRFQRSGLGANSDPCQEEICSFTAIQVSGKSDNRRSEVPGTFCIVVHPKLCAPSRFVIRTRKLVSPGWCVPPIAVPEMRCNRGCPVGFTRQPQV